MKKFYSLVLIIVSLQASQKLAAQCTCSGGIAPDSIAYEQYFDSLITTNTTISFPKFDPSIGTLSCIKLSDTVTTVVSYNLENNLAYSQDYNFETYRRSQFTGPNSFFMSKTSPAKTYGPYTLAAYDSVGTDDEINVGPDTVFNKEYQEKWPPVSSAYYGTDSVNFNYLTTSTFTILTGSDNAKVTLRAYTRLDVKLVYYYCPFTVLETRATNFNASLNDKNVAVQWQVNVANPTDKYELEVSKDGNEFKNMGQAVTSNSGTVSYYKYLYNLESNYSGNLYFRIRKTDYAGRIIYSDIKTVSVNKNHTANYSLYPNPTVSGVNLQFLKSDGGNYEVTLTNAAGQSVFQKKYVLSHSGSINIEWAHKPAAGIYYLKVIDLKSNTQQIEKLQIL